MKAFSLFFSAAAAALLCCSCGPEQNAGEIKIGVSIPAADHGWTGGVVWAAQQSAKEWKGKKVKVIVSTAKDSAEQIDKIENLLVQNVDALVVLPQEPEPLLSICSKVKKQNRVLVTVDRGLTKDVQDTAVAGDNPGFGAAAAEAMAKALGGKGDILIMEGIPCVVNTDRVNAFKKVMAKYPGIRILESQSAYWDTEKGLKLMENFLQKYKKIDAVWAGDDDVLIGALKALSESGRKDVKLMIGGGGAKAVVKMIRDGNPIVRLTVTYPPDMIARGVEQAVAIVKKQNDPAVKKIVVSSEIVTRENAEKYYHPDSAY